jgi:hypothetical protein
MPIIWWPTLMTQRRVFEASMLQLAQLRHMSGLAVLPHPIPIYHLGIRDLVRVADPSMDGKLVGWRYYAMGHGADAAIAGDVDLSTPPRVIRLSYGPVVRKALAAQRDDVRKVPDIDTTRYEPRLLRVPGLLAEMFWLKSLSQPRPDQDSGWVIPYHTFITGFACKEAHAMNAFKGELCRIAAEELLKVDPDGAQKPV